MLPQCTNMRNKMHELREGFGKLLHTSAHISTHYAHIMHTETDSRHAAQIFCFSSGMQGTQPTADQTYSSSAQLFSRFSPAFPQTQRRLKTIEDSPSEQLDTIGLNRPMVESFLRNTMALACERSRACEAKPKT